MGEKLNPLPVPPGIPEWLWNEVTAYDLPLNFTPGTVLDIGANVGAFTLLALRRWPQAVIHAYEPVDDNLAALFRNTNDHEKHVTVFPSAVRSFNGEENILIGDHGATCSFFQLGRQREDTERCKCVDAASLDSAEFVKVDTEGCELEIVSRLDLSRTKVLCVEYHFKDDVAHLKHLAALNDLELHLEKPLGETWGLLIFARHGAIKPSTSALRPSTSPKVFIALPVYGALDVFFTQSLLKLINAPPAGCRIALRMNPGDSLVSRSRNTLTADFLESDATHLLFIDSDLIFSGEQIARLVSHGKDIVAGFYPKKQEGPVQWVCNGHLTEQPVGEDGLQEVRYMGTGFLLVHRRVFEAMIRELGRKLAYKPDHRDRTEHDFWSVGVYKYGDGTRRYLSEDWFFCQRALDLGFKVWGDTRVVLKHVGQAVYPLRSQEAEIFAPAASIAGSDRAERDAIAPITPARNSQPVSAS